MSYSIEFKQKTTQSCRKMLPKHMLLPLPQQVTRAEAYLTNIHHCPDKTVSFFTVMNSALTSLLWQILFRWQ